MSLFFVETDRGRARLLPPLFVPFSIHQKRKKKRGKKKKKKLPPRMFCFDVKKKKKQQNVLCLCPSLDVFSVFCLFVCFCCVCFFIITFFFTNLFQSDRTGEGRERGLAQGLFQVQRVLQHSHAQELYSQGRRCLLCPARAQGGTHSGGRLCAHCPLHQVAGCKHGRQNRQGAPRRVRTRRRRRRGSPRRRRRRGSRPRRGVKTRTRRIERGGGG